MSFLRPTKKYKRGQDPGRVLRDKIERVQDPCLAGGTHAGVYPTAGGQG